MWARFTFLVVVIRHSPVAVESNTDLAFLCGLELLAIYFHSMRMGKNETVPDTEKREKFSAIIPPEIREKGIREKGIGKDHLLR